MVKVSQNAEKVHGALKDLGAVSEDVVKSADQVMHSIRMGKGQIASALSELQKKGLVERVSRQKRAGYYVTKEL